MLKLDTCWADHAFCTITHIQPIYLQVRTKGVKVRNVLLIRGNGMKRAGIDEAMHHCRRKRCNVWL